MTEKEKAIAIIKNIIDYNSVEPWGRALRYAVKQLEEKLTPRNNNINGHSKDPLIKEYNNK